MSAKFKKGDRVRASAVAPTPLKSGESYEVKDAYWYDGAERVELVGFRYFSFSEGYFELVSPAADISPVSPPVDKPDFTLLPLPGLTAVAELMTKMQGGKYAEPKWPTISRREHVRKALGHVYEHLRGVTADEESGMSPLAHAAARLLMALATS